MSTKLYLSLLGSFVIWVNFTVYSFVSPPLAFAKETVSIPINDEMYLDITNMLSDFDLMARTLWGEARSQSDEEVFAIAHVILNRLYDGRYGSTITEVIKESNQFSCWNKSDPNRKRMINLSTDDPSYSRMFEIATRAFVERWWYGIDRANGARHYHHNANPDWTDAAVSSFQVGDGSFYVLSTR